MAKNVSVTLSIIDQMSQKLDAIAGSADKALNRFSNYGTTLDQSFERTTGRLERMNSSFLDSADITERYADQSNRAAQALQEQAESIDQSTQMMEEQLGIADNAAQAFEEQADSLNDATEAIEEQINASDNIVRALDEQANSADEAAQGYDELGEQAAESSERASQAAMDLGDALVAAGIVVALKAIADAYNACDEAADNFETAMAKVSTIADTSSKSLDAIQSDIVELSKETGVAVSDISESVYGAISAGVDTANAVEFVSQANALAVGGFTQTATAVDILTTALNAYGMEASETQNIADMLITTQNLGKTTVDELASSMGKIIPTANSLGVELDVLCGAYAVMTSGGIATAETTTYMNSMLNELGKSGSKAAEALAAGTEHIKAGGLTMAEAMKSGMGLTDVLEILNQQALESGTSISNMFGSAEAGKAANVLYGNAAKVDNAIKQMGSSAGAAQKAFEQMSDTGEFVDQKFQNSIENLKIAIGNAQPSLDGLMEKGTEIINKLAEFVDQNPVVVEAIASMAVGLGAFTVAMTAYTAGTLIAEKATIALTAAMDANPIFLVASAITALVAGIVVFESTMNDTSDALTALNDRINDQQEVVDSLSETYGYNNEKTVEARDKLIELQAQYELTKSSVDNYVQSIQKINSAVDATDKQYNDTETDLKDQEEKAKVLIEQLEKLGNQSRKTAFEQEYEKNLVSELNDIYPELGLAYDSTTGSITKSTAYLKRYCEQKKEEQMLEAKSKAYTDKIVQRAECTKMLEEAQKDLNGEAQLYFDALEKWNNYEISWDELEKVKEQVGEDKILLAQAAQDTIDEMEAKIAELDDQIASLSPTVEGTSESISNGFLSIDKSAMNIIDTSYKLEFAMGGVLKSVQEQSQNLAQAYKDAFTAASQAVESSFGMFEKIENKTKITTKSMIEAWKSQEEYLLNYAANIEKAKDLGIDESLVQKLADGSQESAAALDAIIGKVESLGGTTDEAKKYIGEMNDSFRGVEEAKGILEEAMVGANTVLNNQMEELKSTMETGIDNLNLSESAATSAKATMDAYIAEIISSQSSAESAADAVKAAVENALSGTKRIFYKSGYNSGYFATQGHAAGVNASKSNLEKTYSNLAKDCSKAVADYNEEHSPAKLYKRHGKYTVQGLILGVEEEKSNLIKAYENLASSSFERYSSKISDFGTATTEYLDKVTEKFGANSKETAEAVDFISEQITKLSENYKENFDSAYKNIEGVLGMFNNVEIGSSKSIDEMIDSLKKQQDYMAEYGAYIKKAMEMGVDEGLLEKLSNGSTESAAILKEIVNSGQEKIDALNKELGKVEEGKNTFSAAIAEMKTFYGSNMDEMIQKIESATKDMDKHDVAKSSAENTCKGFIEGINEQEDTIVDKMKKLSDAISDAFAPVLTIPSVPTPTVSAHANGTVYGEDIYIAGENGPELIVGRRGSEVFPAAETARILAAVMSMGRNDNMDMAPEDIINVISKETKSENTENKNLTLTIKGKGSFGVDKGVSKNEVINYLKDEIEGVLINLLRTEMYEEGETAYEF